MRTGISITVSASDYRRLEAIVSDRNAAQKHVWRWQERFAEAGVEGLLSDKTRPPGKARISTGKTVEVVRLTQAPPPHEATHWTARAMAKAVGLGVATVQRIWAAHGLAPHRWRIFKLSKDAAFADKLHDIVGLYVSPPTHAVVLSVDEKSQIQALDRTQPGLPMKKGRGATMTHDYKTVCPSSRLRWLALHWSSEGCSDGPSRSSPQEDEPWQIIEKLLSESMSPS